MAHGASTTRGFSSTLWTLITPTSALGPPLSIGSHSLQLLPLTYFRAAFSNTGSSHSFYYTLQCYSCPPDSCTPSPRGLHTGRKGRGGVRSPHCVADSVIDQVTQKQKGQRGKYGHQVLLSGHTYSQSHLKGPTFQQKSGTQ